MIRRPPRSTLLPSTTLSRSRARLRASLVRCGLWQALPPAGPAGTAPRSGSPSAAHAAVPRRRAHVPTSQPLERSEEHTSELQSRQYLVCRLLLEKKNKEQRQPESTFNHSYDKISRKVMHDHMAHLADHVQRLLEAPRTDEHSKPHLLLKDFVIDL